MVTLLKKLRVITLYVFPIIIGVMKRVGREAIPIADTATPMAQNIAVVPFPVWAFVILLCLNRH